MNTRNILTTKISDRITTVLLITLLGGTSIFSGWMLYSPHPCFDPVEYSIGRVDPEFGMDRDTFRELVREAEQPWENAIDKELFVYNPDADFTVNLIFDERQRDVFKLRQIREEITDLAKSHEQTLVQYESLVSRIEGLESTYRSLEKTYEQDLTAYNNEVEVWNKRGGAPPEERRKLEERRDVLNDMRTELEKKADRLDNLSKEMNQLVQRNQVIKEMYNIRVGTYGDRYGSKRQFEQGHVTPDAINIYQYNQKSDLLLVLVHEFGHTLGIEHVDEPTAVMHYLMEKQQLDPVVLTPPDIAALNRACENASYFLFW